MAYAFKNMKVTEIEKLLKQLNIDSLEDCLPSLKEDQRPGVIKLYTQYLRKLEKHQLEVNEWTLKMAFDEVFHENVKTLVGVDEVGRGPLAGPVVAAAVILPYDAQLLGVKDSKKLSEDKREQLFQKIQDTAIDIGIGIVDPQTIDSVNILNATYKAMQIALSKLKNHYDVICVDGNQCIPDIGKEQHAIIGGDNKSAAIAAASIIAKVTRDRMMRTYAKGYPEYGWDQNKGYGSEMHYKAIKTYGITPLHRKSFLKNEGIF